MAGPEIEKVAAGGEGHADQPVTREFGGRCGVHLLLHDDSAVGSGGGPPFEHKLSYQYRRTVRGQPREFPWQGERVPRSS